MKHSVSHVALTLIFCAGLARSAPMSYRSTAFTSTRTCTPDVMRESARLGYNDICFHTEHGDQLGDLQKVRSALVQGDMLTLADSLRFTISVWVHEFIDPDPSWGDYTVDNDVLWEGIRQRYDNYMTTVFPEVNYWVLTTSECDYDPWRIPELYGKLVTTLNDKCIEHGDTLILRDFGHSPSYTHSWPNLLAVLPSSVIVQTKCVVDDWHMRGLDHPLIGTNTGHREFVEFDVAGEYFRRNSVANCFTGILEHQLSRSLEKGVTGISVRTDRYGRTAFNHPNIVNFWYLGMRASGEVDNQDDAWQKYAIENFGAAAAPAMIAALRPTGQVMAEALCIGSTSFGNTRRTTPADNLAELEDVPSNYILNWKYDIGYNPDTPLKAEYDSILAGADTILNLETTAWATQAASCASSLATLETAQHDLSHECYELFHWLLEENAFHLNAMEEEQLAWLKTKRYFATPDTDEREEWKRQVLVHLSHLEGLLTQTDATIDVTWQGRQHRYTRGSYMDIQWFVDSMSAWLEMDPGQTPTAARQVENARAPRMTVETVGGQIRLTRITPDMRVSSIRIVGLNGAQIGTFASHGNDLSWQPSSASHQLSRGTYVAAVSAREFSMQMPFLVR